VPPRLGATGPLPASAAPAPSYADDPALADQQSAGLVMMAEQTVARGLLAVRLVRARLPDRRAAAVA
jgi:hypothetical protein